MNLTNRPKLRLVASLLLPIGIIIAGTASGAQTMAPTASAPVPTATTQSTQPNNPELDNADQRVNDSKTKLDTARKQLSAAKAIVKAAEAEFRAAKADRDAIALRANAQQLADASGFPVTTMQPGSLILPAGGGNRLTPVDLSKTQTTPVIAPVTPVPLTPTESAQALPFNSQPPSSVSAPAPAANDLRPSLNVTEPNSVP